MNAPLRYYGTILTGEEAKAYYAIASGLDELARQIRVPRLAYQRLTEIFLMVKYDYPAYFYAGPPSYRAAPSASHVELIPDYFFSLKEIPTLRAAVGKRLQRLTAPAQGMNDAEKLRCVWAFLRDHVIYEKLTRQYSHEVYGVLLHGIGVCEGIAKTAKLFFDFWEIDSAVVLSETGPEGVRHAWNIVWLYGEPRHYDFTFDLARAKEGKKPIYRHLTDEAIFRDHRPSVFPLPPCS